MDLNEYFGNLHEKLKNRSPLVHNITNYVVMNSSANILLAAGASPVMAHSLEEVEEMTSISNALVLNIGTLSPKWVDAMIIAGKTANKANIPVILDPVGSGATNYRTDSVKKILDQVKISVIRGNASEIFSIDSDRVKTRGVDSSISSMSNEIIEASIKLSEKLGTILAISGKKDIVTKGNDVITIENGHPVLTRITGMGCGLSAVIGAFCGVLNDDCFSAAAAGFAYYGVCADLTAKETILPGSFNIKFMDTLYSVTKKDIISLSKINKLNG